MKAPGFLTGLFVLLFANAYCQQTVGLFLNDSLSFNGYTLLFPLMGTNTYLIDNCGNEVHRWTSSYRPGAVAYLLENGHLMRTASVNSSVFSGGGSGGKIEEYDWDGNLVWSYDYATSLAHQHHDIEVLPNGHLLILAWEYKSQTEAVAQGRNPSTVNGSLWPDHIVEVEKLGTNQGNIVWEWHAWDHLVQDYDSAKANYGVVADHPELINLNYTFGGGGPGGNSDWMHCNSVDYNADFDQVLVSVHNFGEVWIIDHSTSTAEASGHSGGTYGRGGDLLYRFGNPRAYERGNIATQTFSGQHDAHWIPAGLPNAGKIMVFNNSGVSSQSSAVDIFEPPMDSPGIYTDPGSNAYGPSAVYWRYTANGFFSNNISGAQTQPNGNILICEGASGTIFEITPDSQVVWNYINPVTQNGPLSQGANAVMNNVFRAYRYAPDYGAFTGHTLVAGQPIELNPLPSICQIYTDTMATGMDEKAVASVYIASPAGNELVVQIPDDIKCRIELYTLTGQKIWQQNEATGQIMISTTSLTPGLYIARVTTEQRLKSSTFKILVEGL